MWKFMPEFYIVDDGTALTNSTNHLILLFPTVFSNFNSRFIILYFDRAVWFQELGEQKIEEKNNSELLVEIRIKHPSKVAKTIHQRKLICIKPVSCYSFSKS